jgi:hypothetical protein
MRRKGFGRRWRVAYLFQGTDMLFDSNQHEPGSMESLSSSFWFLSYLCFYPEDGGDMFLRNVGLFSHCHK